MSCCSPDPRRARVHCSSIRRGNGSGIASRDTDMFERAAALERNRGAVKRREMGHYQPKPLTRDVNLSLGTSPPEPRHRLETSDLTDVQLANIVSWRSSCKGWVIA